MNESVTLNFVPEQVIAWVIVGLIAGLFAGFLIRGRRFGFVSSVVVGLLGALLGGFLFFINRFPMVIYLEEIYASSLFEVSP